MLKLEKTSGSTSYSAVLGSCRFTDSWKEVVTHALAYRYV